MVLWDCKQGNVNAGIEGGVGRLEYRCQCVDMGLRFCRIHECGSVVAVLTVVVPLLWPW